MVSTKALRGTGRGGARQDMTNMRDGAGCGLNCNLRGGLRAQISSPRRALVTAGMRGLQLVVEVGKEHDSERWLKSPLIGDNIYSKKTGYLLLNTYVSHRPSIFTN